MADNIKPSHFPVVFQKYTFLVPLEDIETAVRNLEALTKKHRAGVMELVNRDLDRNLHLLTNPADPQTLKEANSRMIGIYALTMWFANEVVEGRSTTRLN